MNIRTYKYTGVYIHTYHTHTYICKNIYYDNIKLSSSLFYFYFHLSLHTDIYICTCACISVCTHKKVGCLNTVVVHSSITRTLSRGFWSPVRSSFLYFHRTLFAVGVETPGRGSVVRPLVLLGVHDPHPHPTF